ncbi:MAG: alpha/beta hydrolase [Polyangiaceae bacterium]
MALIRVEAGDATLAVEVEGEGPLIICAHGFPDGPESFRHQTPALLAAGLCVARPAMRGYAPSSRSDHRDYRPLTLGRDLLAIAEALSPDRPVHLFGHDWGAVAGYAAAALAPARIATLTTAAVPHLRFAHRFLHPRQLRRSWYIGLFQLERADAALARDDLALVDRLWRDWSPGYEASPDELERVKSGMRGRIADVLGYYRAVRPASGERVLFARTEPPSLYLHGEDDGCVGIELSEGVERAYAGPIDVVRVPGAGHFLHLEQPELVNRRLLAHLASR